MDLQDCQDRQHSLMTSSVIPLHRPTSNVLHFVWVVDDTKRILVTQVCLCVCVCLSVAACPHYCMDPDVTWVVVGVPSSCALLGGFAVGARVSLLWKQRRTRNVSECLYSLYGWFTVSGWVMIDAIRRLNRHGWESPQESMLKYCDCLRDLWQTLTRAQQCCWDGRPYQSKVSRKVGAVVPLSVGELSSHVTQCRLGRDLPPWQVASWSIQPFGHNTPTLQTDRHDR